MIKAAADLEFIWNDGGRAAAGYVGLAGDCVTRSIAIATGAAYRDVYQALGESSLKSPRNGVPTITASQYLVERGWQRREGCDRPFVAPALPRGVAVVHLAIPDDRLQHLTTVIDGIVHDTWNPGDEEEYVMKAYWTPPRGQDDSTLPAVSPKRRISTEQERTQQEFEKILKLLRALDATASNRASTEGEKRNALRMMQNLMLRHNLGREDIVEDDNVDAVQFTRMACPVNERRACNWEKLLAFYVTQHIFPTVQWYFGTKGHRTLFWFYGPLTDVQNAIAVFREVLLTIATSAVLQYGTHVRGSGASYAEGYVQGLPRAAGKSADEGKQVVSERALIHTRTLALQDAAYHWLDRECNVKLSRSRRAGRYDYDAAAASQGKQHGANHKLSVPGTPPRLTYG